MITMPEKNTTKVATPLFQPRFESQLTAGSRMKDKKIETTKEVMKLDSLLITLVESWMPIQIKKPKIIAFGTHFGISSSFLVINT